MPVPVQLLAHVGDFMERIGKYFTEDFSNLDTAQKQEQAAEVRRLSAGAAALVAPMPIPFADIWTITPIQMAMVRAIGNVYGYKIDGETLKEMLGVVGGGMLGQQACLAAFKIGLPGAGGIGGAFFVYSWTTGMGYAAETYFKSGMRATKKELAEARKQGVKQAQSEPDAPRADKENMLPSD